MIAAILKRRSVRQYKPDKISKEDILEIVKAGQFAPTAKNNRSFEFYIVESQNLKDKLTALLNQEFISKAPIIIIPAINPEISVEPIADLSVISENMFLQATELGIGSVWKNVREDLRDQVKEILGIPKKLMIINLIPLGYADEVKDPHSDADFNQDKIHWLKT